MPATFAGKYLAAFTVFFLNFKILAPLVLFISLPANLLINYYKFKYVSNDLEILQLTLIASGVFGPIPIAAIHYALSRRMSGEPVSIFDALSQGMNRWLPLFLAQVVKGFIILAGLIALIIPAFYFAARYALLDPVVVLEHASEPRLRSAELVRGRAWEILGAILLFQVTVFGFAFLVQSIPRSSDPIYAMILECGLDCVLDLFASIGSVLIFLYYWECRHAKGARIDEAIV